jgi:hypothetical protein
MSLKRDSCIASSLMSLKHCLEIEVEPTPEPLVNPMQKPERAKEESVSK